VGAAWLATQEFQMDGWERAEFEPWFDEFSEFVAGGQGWQAGLPLAGSGSAAPGATGAARSHREGATPLLDRWKQFRARAPRWPSRDAPIIGTFTAIRRCVPTKRNG
jgi:hypothetical protein